MELVGEQSATVVSARVRSGISVRELIMSTWSGKKKKKKRSQGMNGRIFSQILASEEKANTTTAASFLQRSI